MNEPDRVRNLSTCPGCEVTSGFGELCGSAYVTPLGQGPSSPCRALSAGPPPRRSTAERTVTTSRAKPGTGQVLFASEFGERCGRFGRGMCDCPVL
ncbi:hypothetical protein TNCT_53932 [Trichonephila clavata]|nr:hypothetical protein TNCT_53932 [Trichonephila clavata]